MYVSEDGGSVMESPEEIARAGRAQLAIEHYTCTIRGDTDPQDPAYVVDLATDLVHFVQRQSGDGLSMWSQVQSHFLCEWVGEMLGQPHLPHLEDLKYFRAEVRDKPPGEQR
jgi:hypothetical protein